MKIKYIPFKELEQENLDGYILYSEKLKTIEWAQRREIILLRDKFTCQKCQIKHSKIINDIAYINYTEEEEEKFMKEFEEEILKFQKIMSLNFSIPNPERPLHQDYQPKYLHVHHKYYIKNTHPWNYPDGALMSVCGSCHQEIHNTENIPVYNNELMDTKLSLTKCSRCNGSGHLSKYHYYMDGICFECNGNKFEEKW